MVRGVLQDAEEKKVTGHSDLQPWLKELGNIVDEADNVVDEIAYEHLRYKVAQKQIWKKVSYFFTLSNPLAFRLKIANRIKDLNLDLASLNDWATGLGLQHRLANKLPEHIGIQQTNSSLVGMGGIGKTTMAKLVYNNELIEKHFYKKMWVCVSENFDEKKILAMMLKSLITNEKGHVNFEDKEAVVQKLKEKFVQKNSSEEIEEKNYLLILDDVWNEEQLKWDNLKKCLLGIGKRGGNRVLVTTRIEKVDSIMGAKHMHLDKLTKEDCWSIIRLKAFGNSPNSSKLEELEELEGIGRNIAEKCKGVALVANVVGGTLCNNINKDYWTSIRDDKEVWDSIENADGVLRVLQLSFDRLPIPALKQCFAFCSIFPKDFVMEKEMLIQLWMGEGYLQPFRKSYKKMEDIGGKSLPSGLPSCTALEKLDISNCDNLISIPDDLRRSWSTPNPACLARLKKLTIGGFSTELKEFPDLGFIGSHLEIPSQLHQDDDSEQQVDDNKQQDDDSVQQVNDNEQQDDDNEQQVDDNEQQDDDSVQQVDDNE
ncbi:hypothetical protein SLEP1_g58472 [Rubroshorea leprosula]|uniref:Uncharacterized protein n=1 Tax=Rubroshorea leprosula TaxID=152421 RepID=A0AAV5MPD6_9ROSI|nr:hypothetical protein SLEP1_g58472 [Rubroshorea leprosula]